MSTIEIIPLILGFLLGMCVMYLIARRWNSQPQQVVSRLERENKKLLEECSIEGKSKPQPSGSKNSSIVPSDITIKWDAPTSLKNSSPVVKRTKMECPGDEKMQHFMNYFKLLEDFHRKTNDIFTLQLHPIMNRFLTSNSVVDENDRKRIILEFSTEVQSLFKRLYEEQQKVNIETENIRLFSSEILDELLDNLESAVKQSTDDAAEMLRFMSTPSLWEKSSLTVPLQKAENSVQLVLTCRNAVRNRMKMELSEG